MCAAFLDNIPLVVDTGSHTCKAGLASETSPRSLFSTLLGRARSHYLQSDTQRIYYGKELESCPSSRLTLNTPVIKRVIKNWEDMELLWEYMFTKELQVSADEHPLLLTEPLYHNLITLTYESRPKTHREKLTEIMFEKFNVPALFLANQSLLALFATGRTTGIVVDCGESVSHVVPICDGYSLPHCISSLDCDLTRYLTHILSAGGYSFNSDSLTNILETIKQTLCYVAVDFTREVDMLKPFETHTLPDGQVIMLGNEKFQVPEVLFRPSLFYSDSPGLHEIVFKSIMKSDIDLRKEFYRNIVLAGGSSMYANFGERLRKDVISLVPSGNVKIGVVEAARRDHLAWRGGSVLASLPTFKNMWVTRGEYAEHGVRGVQLKCF